MAEGMRDYLHGCIFYYEAKTRSIEIYWRSTSSEKRGHFSGACEGKGRKSHIGGAYFPDSEEARTPGRVEEMK